MKPGFEPRPLCMVSFPEHHLCGYFCFVQGWTLRGDLRAAHLGCAGKGKGQGDEIRSEGHWPRLRYRAGGRCAQLASIDWEAPGGPGNTRPRPMRGAASRVFIHQFPVALTEVSPPRTLTRCHFRPPPSTVFPANGGKPQAEKHRDSLNKAASQGVWGMGRRRRICRSNQVFLFFLTGSLLIKAYTIKASPFLPMQHCKFLPVLANPSIISPRVQRVTWEGISSFLLWELCLPRSRRPAQQLSPGDPLLTSPTSWPNAGVGDGAAWCLWPSSVWIQMLKEGGWLSSASAPLLAGTPSPSPFLSSPPVKIVSLLRCWKKRASC